MKILIIGASGIIGKAIYDALGVEHKVFAAHRSSVEYPVDTTDPQSIKLLLERLPKLDAVVNAAGSAPFKGFDLLTEDDYYTGIKDKLMGQVNLVHIAKDYLTSNGSITLTTGILADYPEPGSTALALVNGALHSFVLAAAPAIKNGIRLNAISPGAVEGTIGISDPFAGHTAVSFKILIRAYKESIFGTKTGQIFKIY
ncbi:MAG: short chain dehydrogenase [Mucilaginibacter sp.]|nr:short chain dehydrogenase [Mucilaginibacter sp.]